MLMDVREPEIVDEPESGPRVYATHVRLPGWFGGVLAVFTMFAALGVSFVALFGSTLLMAGIVFIVWPMVFSIEFTHLVFGIDRAPYWRLFLIFLAAGFVAKVFRRHVWQRR